MDRMLRKKRHSGRKGWTWGILLLILLSFFLGACGTGQEAEAGRGAPPEGRRPHRLQKTERFARSGRLSGKRQRQAVLWRGLSRASGIS